MKHYSYTVVTKEYLDSVTTEETTPYPNATFSPDGTEAILTGTILDEETEGVLAVFKTPSRKVINADIRAYMQDTPAWQTPEEELLQ